jgi:hypothetical protein
MTMNNPLVSLMGLVRNGGNPQAMLNQMAQSDPQVRKVLQMMQGKSPAELRRIADNIAAERGTTVEDVARQLGITIPSNR